MIGDKKVIFSEVNPVLSNNYELLLAAVKQNPYIIDNIQPNCYANINVDTLIKYGYTLSVNSPSSFFYDAPEFVLETLKKDIFFNSKDTVDFVAKRPHWYEGLCVLLNIDDSLSFQVINVKNISNRQIVIDLSEERNNHNQYICQLLTDDVLYHNYLKDMLIEVEKYILPNCLMGALPNGRVRQIKIITKCLYNAIKGDLSR